MPKKIGVLFFCFYACLVLTVCVALWCFFSDGRYDQHISNFANTVDPIVDILVFLGAVQLFRKIESPDRGIIRFLVFSSVFVFVCDSSFFTAVYIGKISNINAIDILAVPFLLWVASLIIFFSKLIRSRILQLKNFLTLLLVFCLKDAVIIALYFSSPDWTLSFFSFQGFYEVSSATLVLLVFDLVLLCLIYADIRSVQYFLTGTVVIMAGDTLIKYAYVTRKMHVLPIGDLFWLLGLIFMCFGIYLILADRAYQIDSWFRKTTAIKTRMVLWTFGITILSFIIFLLLESLFSVINKDIFVGLPFFFMTYAAIVIVLAIFVGKTFESPFKKLENNIRALMIDDDMNKLDSDFATDEFRFLHRFIMEAYEQKEAKDRAKKQLGEITAQVAHDVRSPLSALNTCLKHLPQIPEQQRVLMRNAANRINDIANNLLEQYKGKEHASKGQHKTWLLAPLVDSIISEKRMQFEGKSIKLEAEITNMGFAAFAQFNANEMKRLLSNLINNAIEAFSDDGGIIQVGLDANETNILLKVKDNGCGIPEDKLVSVLEPGVSLKEHGSGLGLAHAKNVIESSHGTLELKSAVGKGTTVEIILPRAIAPAWFVSEISVSPERIIGILDDDQSVHDAWDQRLLMTSPNLQIYHHRTPQAFRDWYLTQSAPIQVFSDYELLGESESGLDVLESLKLRGAILVTSHYENPEIIKRCEVAGIGLLPKSLLAHIPMKLLSHEKQEDTAIGHVDLVLIDDAQLLRENWEFAADLYKKHILTFASVNDFENILPKLNRNTPIYIDSELGGDLKGEDYAKQLFEQGFKEIYLVTGHPASHFAIMPWIRAVLDKNPPF